MSLGGAIDAVIGSRPPIEVDDAFFALVPFDPFPGDGKGKGRQPSVDHLEMIKAGTQVHSGRMIDPPAGWSSDCVQRPCGRGSCGGAAES